MILHLSHNLQTQPPVPVQLKCQFHFRVFQNFKVKLPSVPTPRKGRSCRIPLFSLHLLIMSFICIFAEHWFITKKMRQKHNYSISCTLYISALSQQPVQKKMKLNSLKRGKKPQNIKATPSGTWQER